MGARRGVNTLAFLSCRGPHAIEQLACELARRGLGMDRLLRLRLFAEGPAAGAHMERQLERLLPREHWPALSLVLVQHSGLGAHAVDAIAACTGGAADERPVVLEPGLVVRHGPWVFLGALSGHSETRGSLPERIRSESLAVFWQMRAALEQADATLSDVIKVGGWLGFPMSDYEPLGMVRTELLAHSSLFPASAAAQVGGGAVRGGAVRGGAVMQGVDGGGPLVAFEAVAFTGAKEGGGHAAGGTSGAGEGSSGIPTAPALAPYYATARSASGYVFTCGEIPRAQAAGGRERTGRRERTDGRERAGGPERAGGGGQVGKPVSAQVDDIYEQLSAHIAAHGASLHSVLHQTVYLRRWEEMPVVRERMGVWVDRTPTTFILAADIGFREGVDVEIELVARAG